MQLKDKANTLREFKEFAQRYHLNSAFRLLIMHFQSKSFRAYKSICMDLEDGGLKPAEYLHCKKLAAHYIGI